MNKFANILTALVLGLSIIVGSFILQPKQNFGAVVTGSEYTSTSTAQNSVYGAITGPGRIKSGFGSLGTIVITGANTGIINLYDATTTDVTKRTGNVATSTILIASIPSSLVAGDYVYDVSLSYGLYLDLVSGNMPTTTISYR